MNVVILHCHFERGGVTQVVQHHVRGLWRLDTPPGIALIAGGRQSGLSEDVRRRLDLGMIPDFDYDAEPGPAGSGSSAARRQNDARASAIADRVERWVRGLGWGPDDTVLHWHNPGLGKNVAAPLAILRLARRGWRLLLQVHDFAEDDRPENYLRLIRGLAPQTPAELERLLYPNVPGVHYACLTRADAGLLIGSGIAGGRVHHLPNAVDVGPSSGEGGGEDPEAIRERAIGRVRTAFGLPAGARWCLYPVRGIRRKNVGEFLLLCRWLPPQVFGGLTLRPATPTEARSYDRWRSLAPAVAPRAIFDAGHHPEISYPSNLTACDFVVSTSVAEGFGMALLEPWIAGRPVVSRHLPAVMDDLVDAGMRFEDVYSEIPIPGSEAWRERVAGEVSRQRTRVWASVPPRFRPPMADIGLGDGQGLDFGRLPPSRQVEVLVRLAQDPGFERDCRTLSAPLVAMLERSGAGEVVDHNRRRIRQSFSLEIQARRLEAIYEAVLGDDSAGLGDDPAGLGDAAGGDPVGRGSLRDARTPPLIRRIGSVHPAFPCRWETFVDDVRHPLV